MRPRHFTAALVVAALPLVAAAGDELRDLYHPHRGESLGIVPGETPAQVRLLPPGGPAAWPGGARVELESRVRREWRAGLPLGAVRPGVGVWVTHPLVTAPSDGRVLLPLVETSPLPLRGSVALPPASGPRRVVLLVDASSSANAPVLFHTPSGVAERVPVLEAERRALRHLVEGLDLERVELGVVAFGEQTYPVVEPGASRREILDGLDAFRRERPKGEGRTDAVCALWLARDWLEDTPDGRGREIVLLTDGDLPHSGRFARCDRARSDSGRAACEARQNATPCPASHRFRRGDGESDLVQLSSFARKSRRHVRVHTLVFERDRAARPFRELAEQTRGRFVQVPSAEGIEAALPALVGRRVRRVIAANLSTGEVTGDLYDDASHGFDGAIALRPGANDVELRIEGDRGVAGLFRYRVWYAPGWLESYLASLRVRNRSLGLRLDELVAATRDEIAPGERRLEVTPDPPPAASPH